MIQSSVVRQLVYQVCYSRYQVSFYLLRVKPLLKHCKAPKYYDQHYAKSSYGFKPVKTNTEGNQIKNISAQFGLHQVINELTHIYDISSNCIDLLFPSESNLIVDSGVHAFLHPNRYHQIIFVKFD